MIRPVLETVAVTPLIPVICGAQLANKPLAVQTRMFVGFGSIIGAALIGSKAVPLPASLIHVEST